MAKGAIAVAPLGYDEYNEDYKFDINFGEVKTRPVSVREIYDAIARNGVEHIRGSWIHVNKQGLVSGGCVLAQGALNLRTRIDSNGTDLYDALNRFYLSPDNKWYMDPSLPVGSTIVRWNDKREGRIGSDGKLRTVYVLRTWNQVLKMVYEVLEPFFDETINLPYYEY
jgi:hypothetical protein